MIVSEVLILQSGDTALLKGAMGDRVEAVKALVNCGAPVDIRNKVCIANFSIVVGYLRTVTFVCRY
jgi:hypothetical protein